MLKNILIVGRKLASAALNFLIVYFETIALPMSWALGGTIMFTMYTELSNIFNGAVCLLVGLWQLGCVFTGRELPLWLKRLKFISTSCLAMTFLTVVIILAPMYEDGNGWYIMLFTDSMLYHHFLNPVLAILSLVLFERLPRLSLGQVWWALVPTVLYGLYDLHGNITGTIDGPYPFMRVYDQTAVPCLWVQRPFWSLQPQKPYSSGIPAFSQASRVAASQTLAWTSPMWALPSSSIHRRLWPMPPPMV